MEKRNVSLLLSSKLYGLSGMADYNVIPRSLNTVNHHGLQLLDPGCYTMYLVFWKLFSHFKLRLHIIISCMLILKGFPYPTTTFLSGRMAWQEKDILYFQPLPFSHWGGGNPQWSWPDYNLEGIPPQRVTLSKRSPIWSLWMLQHPPRHYLVPIRCFQKVNRPRWVSMSMCR